MKARILSTDPIDPTARKKAVRYLKACLAAMEGDTIIPPMPRSLRAMLSHLPVSTRRLCLEYGEVAAIIHSLTQSPRQARK